MNETGPCPQGVQHLGCKSAPYTQICPSRDHGEALGQRQAQVCWGLPSRRDRFPGAGGGWGGGGWSLERGAGVHQVERRGSEEASRRELCGQRPAGVRLCCGWSLLGRGASKVRRAGAGAHQLRDSGPHPEGTGEPSGDLGRKMESTL